MSHVSPTLSAHDDAVVASRAAADDIAAALVEAVGRKGRARALFASAPSQQEMLSHLRTLEVPWDLVEVFHIDEYIGIATDDPRGFGAWLRSNLFDHVTTARTYLLSPDAAEPLAEAERYGEILAADDIDVACIGIGVNGHIAFNEPYDWEIEGGPLVRRVRLHDASRQQQVDDECFARLDEVPHHALTLSVPAILRADTVIVTVTGAHKAAAVRDALTPGVVPESPATALQSHQNVTLHVDQAAAALITQAGADI